MNRNACIVCMTMALFGLGASYGLAGRPKSVPREKVEAVPLVSLMDFERAKYYACQAKTAWEMHFHYKKELDTQYDLKNMDGLLQNEHLFENAPELMPYKEKILGSIARIGMIGDHPAFFILDGLTRPIRLINFENKRCICLYIFSSDMIETTSSPNKKVKAANIINDGLFAAMRSFGTGFDLTDISYISIFYIYGTRDTANDNLDSTKPEVLSMTVSLADLGLVVLNKASQLTVVNKSNIEVSDRNASWEFNKVKMGAD